MQRSQGRFKPSVLGGYERGERSISLERFVELSRLYGIPADRLLAEALIQAAPEGRQEVVLDLNRLMLVTGEEGRIVGDLVHRVKLQRGDYLTDVITLRSGDIEALALVTNRTPAEVLRILQPAVRGGDRTQGSK